MIRIAPRQRDCLYFLHEYIARHGYAPTIREIGDAMGITSTNGVSDHLRGLERKGYIVRGASLAARTVRLTSQGLAAVGAQSASVPDLDTSLLLRVRNHECAASWAQMLLQDAIDLERQGETKSPAFCRLLASLIAPGSALEGAA